MQQQQVLLSVKPSGLQKNAAFLRPLTSVQHLPDKLAPLLAEP